jgi:squalene-hopene/tetraprenyl-beta-curcumene cyclase
VLDVKGDWAGDRPDVRPGGWAFQYNNAHYPDLDDTAVVVMALERAERAGYVTNSCAESISRGREWVEGLQSRIGGWAAFDADNTYYYLNNIPFADHGALLEPTSLPAASACSRNWASPREARV